MRHPVILHICLSKGWGGLEMYPIRMGQQFLSAGYQVFGLCLTGTQVESGMQETQFSLYTARSKSQLITVKLYALIQWVKQHQINVIHCHKSGDLLIAALIKQFVPVKVIFTEHMGVTRSKKDAFHRWVYRHVDQVLSISDETYQRNLNALPVAPERISRLWLGTEIPDKTELLPNEIAAIKHSLSLPEKDFVIGTIGRISPGKGQIELVKAFARVQQSLPHSKLVIVGGLEASQGCDLAYLSQVKEIIQSLDLINHVIFTGFRQDTQQLLSIMDIVCLPYANEAFGLTAIETMAAQRPIVAANTGALPELLENYAQYCSPTSDQSIAQAILNSYEHYDEAKNNAISARIRACKEFSIQTHTQNLLHYYQE
ncbi:glycosyltransferase [Vibrio rhizosphaerae]|uniref:Glycosyltransferase n=2 Tax=Vibrio rhizosphaerae TaxID=398736 RepID=A0ABU4IQC2_9VIBR|nr:glycosyltransferase [Vibrio rhizosphaerae]MDW6091555.1 glycosyltransferase [Vibrio rhizosphaerae]